MKRQATEFTVNMSDCRTRVRFRLIAGDHEIVTIIDRPELARLLATLLTIHDAMGGIVEPEDEPPDSEFN